MFNINLDPAVQEPRFVKLVVSVSLLIFAEILSRAWLVWIESRRLLGCVTRTTASDTSKQREQR